MGLENESQAQCFEKFRKAVEESVLKNNISSEEAVVKVLKELSLVVPNSQKPLCNQISVEELKGTATNVDIISEDEDKCDGVDASRQEGFYILLIDLLKTYSRSESVRNNILKMLIQVVDEYPFFMRIEDLVMITALLGSDYGISTQILVLNLCACCGANENLKMVLRSNNVLESIDALLKENKTDKTLLIKMCDILKITSSVTVLPEFQTYQICYHVWSDAIGRLVYHLTAYREDKQMSKKILNTLAAITSRECLCQTFFEVGGLDLVSQLIEKYAHEEEVIFNCFKVLNAVTRSDGVRDKVTLYIHPSVVVSVFAKYYDSEQTSRMILGAIVSITLRHGPNGKVLVENGLIEILRLCLSRHMESTLHLRRGCWVIVNIISRNQNYREQFLKCGLSGVIQDMMTRVKNCQFECRAALTQLGYRIQQIDRMIKRANV